MLFYANQILTCFCRSLLDFGLDNAYGSTPNVSNVIFVMFVNVQTLAVPRNDDWTKLVHTLQDVKMEQAEQDSELQSAVAPSQSLMR